MHWNNGVRMFFEVKKGVAFIRQRLLILLIKQFYLSEETTSHPSVMAAKFDALPVFVKTMTLAA